MPIRRAIYTNSTRRPVAIHLTFVFNVNIIIQYDCFLGFVISVLLICLARSFFKDIFYTQLSGPGIELAIMISFIKLRSALKLIGSQDFVKNGFDYNKN